MNVSTKFGNHLFDYGFSMIPNILLDNQGELGISDEELLLIIKASRHAEMYKIHDAQLDPTVSDKTLQRRRKSLKEKGYLETTVYKSQNEDGTWHTDGIIYDLTKLNIILQDLADKASAERTKKVKEQTKTSTLHNTNYNTNREISIFTEQYKTRYGIDYKITSTEKLLLHSAPKEFNDAIPYIFEYSDYQKQDGKLKEEFVPRLVFFLKVKFRQAELIEFANRCIGEINEIEEKASAADATLIEEGKFMTLLKEKGFTIKDFIQKLKKDGDHRHLWFSKGMRSAELFKYGIEILQS